MVVLRGISMVARNQTRSARSRSGFGALTPALSGSAGIAFFGILTAARLLGIYHGEFDPGSERTLAACLKHASRAASAAMRLERRTGE